MMARSTTGSASAFPYLTNVQGGVTWWLMQIGMTLPSVLTRGGSCTTWRPAMLRCCSMAVTRSSHRHSGFAGERLDHHAGL